MLQLYGKFTIRPGKKAAVIMIFEPLIENTREEEGNIKYELFENITNENILTFFAQFDDAAAVNIHTTSDYFQKVFRDLELYLTEAPVIETYTLLM
jgi:quinol monooxygenase YgiN